MVRLIVLSLSSDSCAPALNLCINVLLHLFFPTAKSVSLDEVFQCPAQHGTQPLPPFTRVLQLPAPTVKELVKCLSAVVDSLALLTDPALFHLATRMVTASSSSSEQIRSFGIFGSLLLPKTTTL